jgi:hypothetical protein
MRGERFFCLAGRERLLWDIETSNSESVAEPKNLDLK